MVKKKDFLLQITQVKTCIEQKNVCFQAFDVENRRERVQGHKFLNRCLMLQFQKQLKEHQVFK